jgi:hypothetical protein
LCVYVEKENRGGEGVQGRLVLVLMCAEVLMGRVSVRIKHGRNLCSKCL